MHFSFLNLKLWWLDLLLGLILFSATYIAYKQLKIAKQDKQFLIILRSLIISLFLLAFIQPVFHYTFFKYTKPNLAILIDNSASMGVQKNNISLFQQSHRFINQSFKSLHKNFNIKKYYFSDNLLVASKNTKPNGYNSDLAQSLQTFFYNFSDDNYRGLLLFSDGQIQNNERLDSITKILKNNNIPLIPVLPIQTFQFSDVAVQFDPENPTELKTGQKTSLVINLKNTTTAKQFHITIYDNGQSISSKMIHPQTTYYNFPLPYYPKKTGIHKLKVVIQANDKFQKNNQDFLFVKVNKGKYNVGLIYGDVNWEYKFLKRTLSDDGNIKLYSVVKIKNNTFKTKIRNFPLTQMDLLILGNVSQNDFPSSFFASIAKQVELRGMSLFLLGGPKSFLSEKITNPNLKKILPVIPNAKMGKITNPTILQLTSRGKNDSLTQISDDAIQNEKEWQNIPPFSLVNWCMPKKNTTILAVSSKNKKIPLLGYQYAKKGKVLFFTGFPLWHWYFLNVPTHKQQNYISFIRLIVRDLTLSRLERFNLYTDKFLYQPNEVVKIYAVLFNKNYTPINQKIVHVNILQNGKIIKTLTLKNSSTMKERFSTEWLPDKSGEYQLRLNVAGKQKKAFFVVGENQTEYFNIGLNRSSLDRIAKLNKTELMTKENVKKILKKMNTKKIKQKFSIKKELWNSFLIILIIVGLLTLEWIYRKNKGLL